MVRSSSSTIRIPVLGANIEPGDASEALISNVEGVLWRIHDILSFLAEQEDPPSIRKRVSDRLHKL